MKAGCRANWAAKWTGLATALLLLATDVSAQGQQQPPSPDRGVDARPQQMGQGPHQQRGRGNGAGPQQGAAPTAGPAQFAADGGAPRGGQMSREERRQLRRDVHEAGRDLYPERKHGSGREQNQSSSPRQSPTQ